MLEKLRLVEERYMEMEERAAQPDFYADPKAATKLLKEQKQLEPIIKAYRAYKAAEQAMAEARELMDAGDPELKALCQEEFSAAKQDCERLEHELKILLLDAQDEGHKKPCGGLLAPDAQKTLAHFDLVLPKSVLADPQIRSEEHTSELQSPS